MPDEVRTLIVDWCVWLNGRMVRATIASAIHSCWVASVAHIHFPTWISITTAVVEHEATTSKISEDQLFYCNQRGISTEDAVGLIVNGYAKEVLNKLPMEFAVEAQKLLSVSLEGSVG